MNKIIEEENYQYAIWYDRWMNGISDDRIIAKRILESIEKARLERSKNETSNQP